MTIKIHHIILLLIVGITQNAFTQQSFDKALELYNSKRYLEASEIFENQILKNPQSKQNYEYLVNCYSILNNFSGMISTLEKAIKNFPGNDHFLFALGQVYANQKNYESAEKHLKRINSAEYKQKANELLSIIYFNQGVASFQNKKNDESVLFFEKSIKANNNYKDAHLNLITVLYESQKFNEAKKEVEKALKLFPGEKKLKLLNTAVLIQLKEYDQAIISLDNLNRNYPDEIEISLQLAKVYRYKYNLDKANEIYKGLLLKYPEKKEIYNDIIEQWTLFNKQDKLRETYKMMLEKFPYEKELVLKIGKTYEDEEKYDEAKKYYLGILEDDSINSEVRFALSNLFYNDSDFTSAAYHLNKLLEVDADNYLAYKKLNNIYFERKNYKQAIRLNRSFFQDNYFTFYQLSLAYQKLFKLDSAEYFIEKAYEKNSDDPFVLKEKATLAKLKKSNSEAANWAKKSLRQSVILLDEKQRIVQKDLTDHANNLEDLNAHKYESFKEDIDLLGENINAANDLLKSILPPQSYTQLLDDYLIEYPKSVFLLLFKAGYLFENKSYEESIDIYRRIITLNPRLKIPHLKFAAFYEMNGHLNDAILSYKRALIIDEYDSSIYDALIRCHQSNGTLSSFGNELLDKYKNNPENKTIKERLIEVFHKSGRTAEARELVNQK